MPSLEFFPFLQLGCHFLKLAARLFGQELGAVLPLDAPHIVVGDPEDACLFIAVHALLDVDEVVQRVQHEDVAGDAGEAGVVGLGVGLLVLGYGLVILIQKAHFTVKYNFELNKYFV
jgi:hypothetical protein